jgi:hypothetical protein
METLVIILASAFESEMNRTLPFFSSYLLPWFLCFNTEYTAWKKQKERKPRVHECVSVYLCNVTPLCPHCFILKEPVPSHLENCCKGKVGNDLEMASRASYQQLRMQNPGCALLRGSRGLCQEFEWVVSSFHWKSCGFQYLYQLVLKLWQAV